MAKDMSWFAPRRWALTGPAVIRRIVNHGGAMTGWTQLGEPALASHRIADALPNERVDVVRRMTQAFEHAEAELAEDEHVRRICLFSHFPRDLCY